MKGEADDEQQGKQEAPDNDDGIEMEVPDEEQVKNNQNILSLVESVGPLSFIDSR